MNKDFTSVVGNEVILLEIHHINDLKNYQRHFGNRIVSY